MTINNQPSNPDSHPFTTFSTGKSMVHNPNHMTRCITGPSLEVPYTSPNLPKARWIRLQSSHLSAIGLCHTTQLSRGLGSDSRTSFVWGPKYFSCKRSDGTWHSWFFGESFYQSKDTVTRTLQAGAAKFCWLGNLLKIYIYIFKLAIVLMQPIWVLKVGVNQGYKIISLKFFTV